MASWLQIGEEQMLSDGGMREIHVSGENLLLVRVGGAYYATQARCPHLRVRLARGTLDGKTVTCPGHGSMFDITTGKNLAWVEGLPGLVKGMARAIAKPKDLKTYAVKVEEDQVWISLEGDA
jgi:nitrite reductase/ring-hydroxylating ferredoxin subunit